MPDSVDAAALRLAFNKATETYPRHLAGFLSKDGEAAFREWWGQFYNAVHNHAAGLEVLAELARLNERIRELEKAVGCEPVTLSREFGKAVFELHSQETP